MVDGRLARIRRGLVVSSALLAAWALAIALSGGIDLRGAGIPVSSRAPRNPFVLAVVSALAAWSLAPGGRRTRVAVADWSWLLGLFGPQARRVWQAAAAAESRVATGIPRHTAPVAAVAIAVAVVAFGLTEGALVAAGADAWAYASQADLWLDGSLRLDQPLMRELSARIPPAMQAPLGYTASPERMDLVPVVGPGLPLVMALAARGGGREAVFYAVPLLAGLATVAVYATGAGLAGRWAGLVSAILLAASPAVLFQLTSSPMSDIPAMAWCGVALACWLREGRVAAVAGGIAAGMALLTRPNLLPLAALTGLWFVSRAVAARAWHGPDVRRVVGYAAGVVPATLLVAALNTYWHGSPLSSGYGPAGHLFSWSNVGPNLARYPRWLVESQSPFILLAGLAPFLLRRRAAAAGLLAWAAAVLASYLAYFPFDAWWYLRFLLPAYPALLTLAAGALVTLAARLPAGTRLAGGALIVALVAGHGVDYARARAAFDSSGEYKYEIAGRYAARHLPPRAFVFAVQHSGSVRYYSGRPTLRWDAIPPEAFDWVVAEIERHGYEPFALVEDWEDDLWRQRLAGHDVLPALKRSPIAVLPLGNVRVYDLRAR